MKKGLRFIIAVLTLASLGTWFLPIAELMGIKVSIADVLIKAGIGYYDRAGTEAVLYGFLRTYAGVYVWIIAGAAGIVLIESVLIAALRKRASYITALILSVINIGAFLGAFFLFQMKLDEIEKASGGMVKITYLALFAWIAVYALNVILSMIGIILWRAPRETGEEEIYLEQISRVEAERARRQSETAAWAPPQEENRNSGAAAVPGQAEAGNTFSGAISGDNGMYSGKIYPMEDKKEVFFFLRGESAVLSPYEEEGAAAGIYYISEYGEYCTEPFEKNTVFLESGQPLGKGRQYYLPRGTKIYMGSRANSFTLV